MKKDNESFSVMDARGYMNPDECTAVPNDLVNKYMRLFKGKKQFLAVMDLIGQAYRAGLEIGRNEIKHQ